MKRLSLMVAGISLVAVVGLAAEPITLDRNGVLWRLTATSSGTELVGTKDGVEVARSAVPFPLGLAGQNDSYLQLVADELTGKVVVAWQRNWSANFSDIVLAVWNSQGWERIAYLTGDPSLRARNPMLKLARATSSYPHPEDPTKTVTVSESFALVLWWQGDSGDQQARLASLNLTAAGDDENAVNVVTLDGQLGIGIGCSQPLPQEVLEHPMFASGVPGPVVHVLAASSTTCLLFVHEIRFELEDPARGEDQGGLGAVALRRRHTPIFGVRKVLPVTRELSAEGTRAVLGADLQPVLYRLVPEGVEYAVATDSGWSPKRLLRLEEGLSLDKAIALVENLAR